MQQRGVWLINFIELGRSFDFETATSQKPGLKQAPETTPTGYGRFFAIGYCRPRTDRGRIKDAFSS